MSNAPESFKGSLADYVMYLSNNAILQDAIDKCLRGKGPDNELIQFLKVVCACVLSASKERPTMLEVYQLLRAIADRYHFTTDDEILLLPQSTKISLDELIVAE